MILIISTRDDVSTNNVIDWLLFCEKKHIRLNSDYFFDFQKHFSFSLNDSKTEFISSDSNLPLKEITSVWYRRSSLESENLEELLSSYTSTLGGSSGDLKYSLKQELRILKNSFFSYLNKFKLLGNFSNSSLNKIDVLYLANSLNIRIPPTLVTTKKRELLKFKEIHRNIIIKPIFEGTRLVKDEILYNSYTEGLNESIITELPNHFFPSLFQLNLTKDFEIRSFFLDGEFYSMAIFSQQDPQTTTDFRKYNTKKGNRTVPYILPDELKKKLRRLMARLELNTGSIDLVRTIDGKIYFLEINPVGQYGMTSFPCNYYLDKKIAEFLAK